MPIIKESTKVKFKEVLDAYNEVIKEYGDLAPSVCRYRIYSDIYKKIKGRYEEETIKRILGMINKNNGKIPDVR